MDNLEAIKLAKTITRYIPTFPYNKYKEIKYEIKQYNYINVDIKYKQIINIGLKELKIYGYKYLDLLKKIHSYNDKQTRIKKRIEKMNPNNIWFATYTINNKNMCKDHVRKLKEINKENNYIINADYGDKTNRKHYHGIIESEKIPATWEYGFCKFIKVENVNERALAKYINKMTNHTIKITAEKIIYSRKK